MNKFDINCDVGEGLNNESELMPYIQSCNIACGGHAGDVMSMKKVAALAIKYQVKIGAHPSYPDKENFGRKTMDMNPIEFKKSIQNQIDTLQTVILELGSELHHIKPHGALYNDIAKSDVLSLLFLEAISKYKSNVKLYVPYNSKIAVNAVKQDFLIIYEAFADRNYTDALELVPRSNQDAVITDPEVIVNRVLEMIAMEKVMTVSGKKATIKAKTFCVHSDTENAIKIVKLLHKNNVM